MLCVCEPAKATMARLYVWTGLAEFNNAINVDIYLFEVNTKYISSSVLRTSESSRVRSTSENSYVFNSRDEICLVFTERSKFSFYFILFIGFMQCLTH